MMGVSMLTEESEAGQVPIDLTSIVRRRSLQLNEIVPYNENVAQRIFRLEEKRPGGACPQNQGR
jgi:hypothetical protein